MKFNKGDLISSTQSPVWGGMNFEVSHVKENTLYGYFKRNNQEKRNINLDNLDLSYWLPKYFYIVKSARKSHLPDFL